MNDFPPCDFCNSSGLVTVYHRFYEGSQLVTWEHTGRDGEVKMIRSAGTVSAHCSCGLGQWMRGKTAAELLPRIPDLADVLAGRTNYQLDDPTIEMDAPEPTESARAFLRRWTATLPARLKPNLERTNP